MVHRNEGGHSGRRVSVRRQNRTRAEIPAKAYSRYANAAQPGRVGALGDVAFACLILLRASSFSPGYSQVSRPAKVESDFSFISFCSGRACISTLLTRGNPCGTSALKLVPESFLLRGNAPFFCDDEINWRPLKVQFLTRKALVISRHSGACHNRDSGPIQMAIGSAAYCCLNPGSVNLLVAGALPARVCTREYSTSRTSAARNRNLAPIRSANAPATAPAPPSPRPPRLPSPRVFPAG